jgi:hypothetical protein
MSTSTSTASWIMLLRRIKLNELMPRSKMDASILISSAGIGSSRGVIEILLKNDKARNLKFAHHSAGDWLSCRKVYHSHFDTGDARSQAGKLAAESQVVRWACPRVDRPGAGLRHTETRADHFPPDTEAAELARQCIACCHNVGLSA